MRRRIPSTTALLCFEAAARTENFARAAEHMNITQSALSRQIQTIEAFVAQSLFARAKQRVTLTTAGRALLADLSPLLESLEAALLKLQSHDSLQGAINIGIYPTLGSRWLMPKIIELQQERDNLTINTITYLDNSGIDPSLVDIAIVQGDPPFKGYRWDHLMPEALMVVGSSELIGEPVDEPLDLLDFRILQHTTRPQSWEIWLAHQDRQLPRKIIGPTFSQFEMLIDATRGGHGIAIIPQILIERELANGALCKAHTFECVTQSAYFMLMPQVKVGIPRLERLWQWFLQNAGSNLPGNGLPSCDLR